MKNITKIAFGAAMGTLLLAGAPTAAFAQNDVSGKNISSLDYESADVREALRALFKNVGVSYTIASDVQGLVTVHLRNIPFEAALQQITRQVDATYRIEGGVLPDRQARRGEPDHRPDGHDGPAEDRQQGATPDPHPIRRPAVYRVADRTGERQPELQPRP